MKKAKDAPSRSYAYGKLTKLRTRLTDAIISHGLGGQQLGTPEFEQLVSAVRTVLRITKTQASTALLQFAGAELNPHTVDRIVVRLAGSTDTFKRGEPVATFSGLPKPEWAPVEIAELRYGQIRNRRLFYNMRMLVMGGTAAGEEILQAFPSRFIIPVLSKSLGWSLRDLRPTHSELVQMWFNARLIYVDNKLQIDEFDCTSSQQKYNKKLRTERATPCIRQYRQQCKACPIGYYDCGRGTHRYTWIFKTCAQCKQEKAVFDPSEPGETVCLRCRTRRARGFAAQERYG